MTESVDLQDTFIKEISKNKCLVITLGQRRSGKTSFSLSILKEIIERRAFGALYLIIPSFRKEADNQYHFLEKACEELIKEGREVTLFTQFNDLVLDIIRKKQAINNGRSALVFSDDSTAFIAQYLRRNNMEMNRLLTELRHKDLNLSVWFIVHSLKGVLSPLIREVLTFLMIFDCTTQKVLHDIWEEYYSLQFRRFNDFLDEVWKEHCKEHNRYTPLVLYTLQGGQFDLNARDWFIYKRNVKFIINQK